jgi:DNA-binding transcriptional ArsR family regulator
MRELVEIRKLAQARALLHPVRVRMLEELDTPRTCRELGETLGHSPQRVHHHLKEMRSVGLIEIVETRRRGNLLEAVYRRTGKAYWFSPTLARGKTAQAVRAELSLHNLLVMSETLQGDVARLLERSTMAEVPSLGFDAEVALPSEADRERFTQDLLRAFHDVAEKYQGTSDDARFKVMVACYPSSAGKTTAR